MTDTEVLMHWHCRFRERDFVSDLPLSPALRVIVVTCVDPRVEPSAVLGLALGDAAVIRNVGGRLTPSTLLQLRLLGGLGAAAPGGDPTDVVLMQHTGCGITRMVQRPDALAAYFEVDPGALPVDQILDPRAALHADLALFAAQSDLMAVFAPVGLLYDLSSGSLDRVELPARGLERTA